MEQVNCYAARVGLITTISASLVADLTKPLDLGVTATAPINRLYTAALASGTAVGQADLVFMDTRTIAPSGTDDLDLAGVLSDPLCTLITMIRVKALLVSASPLNNIANNVVVGAAAANPWVGLLTATSTVTLKPGATLLAFAGAADAVTYPVTAGTGDLLRIANSAGTNPVTYDIIVIGSSA